MPAIAVPADDQLVPGPGWTFVASDLAIELASGCAGHNGAVFRRRRGVTQRLMREIAAVADQMAEQRDAQFGPRLRLDAFREAPGDCQPIAGPQINHAFPSAA